MADRKAELERKKLKLQQMREEKKRKEEEKKRKEQVEAEPSGKGAAQPEDLRAETEQMLKDLGIPATVPSQQAPQKTEPVTSRSVPQPAVNAAAPPGQRLPATPVKLGISKLTQTTIPPKEHITYSKETQTINDSIHDRDVLTFDDNHLDDDLDMEPRSPPAHVHGMPHVEMFKPAQQDVQQKEEKKEERRKVRELSEEEKQQIMMSEDFVRFFDRSTRLIERALAEDVPNIFVDYSGTGEDQEGDAQGGVRLKISREFYDERWSKHRSVTCLDWSTQYPELLVASYNMNEDAPHDPDGVCLWWNKNFKKTTPEYIFHCQSAVNSICFARFHPNLVIGGTYSGQIVLWDNRSNKRTPVQRTPLSAVAHTHPVYCVNVVGTQNAHNLISVSTDGKICSWSLDMLSQPQDSMELQHKQTRNVAATCMSFLSSDVNNFIVGSEEGAVYTACRHGSKAGIGEMFEECHQGPVTGIDCHSVQGAIDFSQLFLTSSFDWTVKLWSAREQKPLYSFEDNSDYVYDVAWSPIHPALFASVDGMGRLDLWNLNNDTEVPTASVVTDPTIALNKCRWHQNGHQIAVGDDMGKIYIYDIGENIANPKMDEWSRMVHTLQEMKANAADTEDDLTSQTSSPLR
ncbi:cytoplasmic dynein 1 intermediate chain 2 isoform X2 [Lingula anatina]|uniref:Cytoplasmic dynein 1 intermediate chain 2 isoform X2 n=1 Tax=Lingula anatina TaxID=7574 RepID=A0A1S3H5C5_LINAN|nr:cytoplasmic dynein 1 intermediate chain 2 isoform X2 [Lingula anatina]|eukprot:XP_013381208.1 cytoplasmic dynein 1 intermediate chain 2 isoform X2 [Lingula anatina]